MGDKAAVLIGVNQTGGLDPLQSAATGAEKVSRWLQSEGFDVTCLTDEAGPVKARDVEDAIFAYVRPPTRYRLFVLYFSGHGLWHARSDRWLLSEAPLRTSEAINLSGAIDLAKYSGVPNVVFISDACRSLPANHSGALVEGVYGFPNLDIGRQSKVDVFRATSEARAAYEDKIAGESQSILTYALMAAYEEPSDGMIREVRVDGKMVKVVPNRRLESYLQAKINEILAGIDINLSQEIEASVPSDDDVFISRVRLRPPFGGDGHPPAPVAEPMPPEGVGRAAASMIRSSLGVEDDAPDRPVLPAGRLPELQPELAARRPTELVTHFESTNGFVLHGAVIETVVVAKANGREWAEILDPGNGLDRPAIVRVWDIDPGTSIAMKLADGRSIVLAGLRGFMGHGLVANSGLANISYIPSDNTDRWPEYVSRRDQIDKLRAEVALAAEHNSFSLGSPEKARKFAAVTRQGKASDPTLGLYAAYAYSEAGQDESVRDVMHFMRSDLCADLFDVRMLSSRTPPMDPGVPAIPFCPMLTQGWNLLRTRRIVLPDLLVGAIGHLTGSLWTTFGPGFSDQLMRAVESGELR